MDRKAALTLGLLVLFSGFFISAPSWAQPSPVPQGCSSPSPADGNVQNSDKKEDAHRKVVIDRIEFDQPVHLSDFDVEQVIKTANQGEWHADSAGWVDELAEIGLRSVWQDQGYFKIVLSARAEPIGGDSDHEHFLVAVDVENEGPQFHLGDIQFTGGVTGEGPGTSIPEAELRQVLPLHEGELFSVGRVRESIVALTKLYGSHGYIDFVAVPETKVDENLHRISLVMRLDEQKQFRVGSFEVRGLDPSLEARLRSVIVPGEVVNYQSVLAFFKENQSALPPRALENNLQILRNVRTGIADVTYDPQSCARLGPS